MLTRLLKFLKGYVVIRLSGYSPERFFNLCSRRGIVLWGLRSVGDGYELCVSIGGFRMLRPLVKKTRTKVVILKRHGLPFLLHRYRRRKLFAAGALVCLFLLWLLSLFIWNIHVEGNVLLSDEELLNFLETRQVVHGMAKRTVRGEEIESELREHFPEITWVSAEVKGTRLIIRVREDGEAEAEAVPDGEPADLVATEAGQIESMIVRSGTPAVREGDEVEAGDLLVGSLVEILDDAGETADTHYVHADADIRIRRTERYEASFPMQYEKKVYTGRTQTAFYLILGRRRLTFSLPLRGGYEQSDVITDELPLRLTENFYLPVTFGRETRKEYISENAVYTPEEAAGKAEEELALFFEKLSVKGLQIIENNVKIETNGDVCTAAGTYLVEEEAVREQAPEITTPGRTTESAGEREES